MTVQLLIAGVVLVLLALALSARRRRLGPPRRRRRRGPGAGAAGAIYEMLNEDRRKALEIVVEERAEATDPEHADDVLEPSGALPDNFRAQGRRP